MESLLLYFDETEKFYLYGNVYNGKTWTIDNGYNKIMLNNIPLNDACDIKDADFTFKFNEYLPMSETKTVLDLNNTDDTKFEDIVEKNVSDGVSFTGITTNAPYFQYNARKSTISKEINAGIYGLKTKGLILNLNLEIGSEYTYNDLIYTDKTNIKLKPFKFLPFTMDKNNDGYKITVDNGYEVYLRKIDSNKSITDDLKSITGLFRILTYNSNNLSENSISDTKKLKTGDVITSNTRSDSIKEDITNFYLIAIPTKYRQNYIDDRSNQYNLLIPITISKLYTLKNEKDIIK